MYFLFSQAKLKEVHGSQSDANKASLATDSLSQVLIPDRNGRTRGELVGGEVQDHRYGDEQQ